MSQDIDYRAVRREVEVMVRRHKSVSRWLLFILNLMIFGLMLLIAWGILKNIREPNITNITVIIFVCWAFSLFSLYLAAMFDNEKYENALRTQAIMQAINKQLLSMGVKRRDLNEKRKRIYSLGDDGELDPLPIEGRDDMEDITLELRDVLRQQSERKQQQE